MSDTPAPNRPMPRPPGVAVPRRPRAPVQRGGDLEPEVSPGRLSRRKLTWAALTGVGLALGGCAVKFFFPRTIRERKTSFKLGPPSNYAFGVDDRWQAEHRVWVVRDATKLYVILAVCTHLGCTPNWVAAESKFKCPCHGSGFDSEGVNFEGPAPRPMHRCKVVIAPDGQLLVDKLVTYKEEDWDRDDAFIPV